MASAQKTNQGDTITEQVAEAPQNNVLDNESSVFDCKVCHAGKGQSFTIELSCACSAEMCMPCMVHWTKSNSGLVCPLCSASGIRVSAGEAAPLADGYYSAAIADLATAQASGFEDKQALKASSAGFLNAIRSDARHVAAYVGMGYLLLLLDSPNHAARYLTAAVDVDPTNEDAIKLLKYVRDTLPGEQGSSATGPHDQGEQGAENSGPKQPKAPPQED